jgi:K+-transporting ATPase A subunit
MTIEHLIFLVIKKKKEENYYERTLSIPKLSNPLLLIALKVLSSTLTFLWMLLLGPICE